MKVLKKSLDPYRHDRNAIVHERQFLEDDIRMLEAYTTLLTSEGPLQGDAGLLEEAQSLAKQVVRDKTKEFSKVNRDSFVAIGKVFDHLNKEYESKRGILERFFGKAELAPLSFPETPR